MIWVSRSGAWRYRRSSTCGSNPVWVVEMAPILIVPRYSLTVAGWRMRPKSVTISCASGSTRCPLALSTAATIEQQHAEMLLQQTNLGADRRLRQANALAGR